MDATAQEVDASTADAATDARIDAAPVFDRRRARTLSDDACETDGDCVVTSFFDCCQHCEGPAINPANARKLAARKLACKTHTCPPSRGTYLCGPTPPPDMAAFCHEHRCVAQKIDY